MENKNHSFSKNKNCALNKKLRGFSIVELMIVMAIISLMVTGGVIKRNETIHRKRAESSALRVKQMIELTKDYALTGESIGGVVPAYFGFEYSGANLYIRDASGNNLDAQTLDTGVTAAGDTPIRFTVPYGEFDTTTPCNPSCVIEIWGDPAQVDTSMRYTLSITPNSVELDLN